MTNRINISEDAKAELAGFVTEVERHEAAIKDRRGCIKDIYATAKAKGYDVQALKRFIAYRKKDAEKIAAQQDMFDFYKDILEPKLPMFGDDVTEVVVISKAA